MAPSVSVIPVYACSAVISAAKAVCAGDVFSHADGGTNGSNKEKNRAIIFQ
jgi:hypothetical protein